MALGMEGIISVAANCFTKDMTDLVNLAIVGKFDKARKVLYRLLPAIDLLFVEGNPAGIKSALKQWIYAKMYFALPLVPVSESTSKKIGQYLKAM